MTQRLILGPGVLSKFLGCLLSLQMAIWPAAAQSLPTALNVVVVQGDDATGKVLQKASQPPVIRVQDESEKPVAGAAVVFTLPTEGATGSFGDGSKTVTLITDARGVASAQGLRFNQIPGKVPVHVNVSYRGLTARAIINQFSEAPAGYRPGGGGGSGKTIAILTVLGAAAAGGAYYALSQNKSTAPPTAAPAPPSAIGVTPGTGSIAPPR